MRNEIELKISLRTPARTAVFKLLFISN